ncbi:hypothetical protein GAY31_09395 [Azospirillum brasilense]|nr:hypothetical protein [Azospirillum brasilense]
MTESSRDGGGNATQVFPRAEELLREFSAMYNVGALCQCYQSIEASCPVNRYKVLGIHIWPLVRILLYDRLLHEYFLGASEDWLIKVGELHAELGDAIPAPHPSGTNQNAVFSYVRDAFCREGAAEKPLFLLFTRHDEHYRKTNQGFRAPLIDPWYEAAAALGRAIKVEMSDPMGIEIKERVNPVLFLPPLERSALEAAAAMLSEKDRCALAELLDMVSGFLFERLSIKLSVGLDWFLNRLIECLAARQAFGVLLDDLKPTGVILTCYYHPVGMGLLWACAERNILSIDVQHGVTGDGQPPYSHWGTIPPDGYALLPRLMAVWGLPSANHILRWLPANGQPHRVVVAGRPDLADADTDEQAEVADLVRGYRHVIIVTLGQLKPRPILVEAMEKAPRDWLWLCRCHPWATRMRMDGAHPEAIEATLRERGITNFDARRATALSLSSLLRASTHHVTAFSSCTLEASGLDVPTTFIDAGALQAHSTMITEGRARFVDSADQLIEAIEQGGRALPSDTLREVVIDPDRPAAILRSLVALWATG